MITHRVVDTPQILWWCAELFFLGGLGGHIVSWQFRRFSIGSDGSPFAEDFNFIFDLVFDGSTLQ